MKTMLTVDQAGRVVLPIDVRKKFHLERGSVLHLHLESDAIVLKAEGVVAPIVQQGAVLVHQGVATQDLIVALDQSRARRDLQVHGFSR